MSRIPMRFQSHGGRKRVVALAGSEIVPTKKGPARGQPGRGARPAMALASMLEERRFAFIRELAEAERVSHSYISRILRLALLAPDSVERILDGRQAPQLAQLMQPFPIEWEQREALIPPC